MKMSHGVIVIKKKHVPCSAVWLLPFSVTDDWGTMGISSLSEKCHSKLSADARLEGAAMVIKWDVAVMQETKEDWGHMTPFYAQVGQHSDIFADTCNDNQ